jgi:ubiquinone/menaquinone biosynthesis C-methylase UbiE
VAGIVFDEGAAKQLEEMYGARDVRRRRALVRQALGAQPGDRVIDVGCGPGFYVSELLDEVGADGAVLGVDAAEAMLGVAAKRCEGRGNAAFEQGDATSLPAADSSFDRALSVQVMEYVPDVAAALAEVHRVLRPGGRVVIWDVDWRTLSWHATDAERMERAQRAWDNHLTHPALPQRLTALLTAAGFEDVAMEGHVFAANRIDPESYLGVTMPLIVAFVATQPEFGPEEAKAFEQDQHELAERGEFYAAVTQFCFSARRPD